MSFLRRVQNSNTALASVVLFLLALVGAPAAMSAIRKSADGPDLQDLGIEVVATAPSETSMAEVVGESGSLRAVIGTPAALSMNQALQSLLSGVTLDAGVHSLEAQAPDGDPLVVVAMQTFDATRSSRHDGYYTGRWASKGLAARDPNYAPPQGYIPVTELTALTPVSERFRLGDFLTHDQPAVWPKVLVLQPRILDKLELIAQGLERRGLSSQIHVLSGFRTPQYNEQGVGKRGGRAESSRHMYGDAADIFVDADGDNRMDDLNHDGKINVRDAQVIASVAEEVEAQHPELIGGLSAYKPTRAHGPFVHVDARGTRARW